MVYLKRSSKHIRKKSFGIKIISAWKTLPDEVANAPGIYTFKNRVDKHILYDYKATSDTSVPRKGSEISIGTNPESDVLTPKAYIIQVTSSNENIQDAYQIQEAAENRHVSNRRRCKNSSNTC